MSNTIKAVLFDLDGTLLPMDNDRFTKHYFAALAALFPQIPARELVGCILAAVEDITRQPGGDTNEAKFARAFTARLNRGAWEDMQPIFTRFYENEFNQLGVHFPPATGARLAVDKARQKGYRIALATNPIFPRAATLFRLRWAGFAPDEFEIITAYEDTCACKPHAAYYHEVLARMGGGLLPTQCAMVGNDVREDILPAKKLGMQTFFLSDCPLNTDFAESLDGLANETAKAPKKTGEVGRGSWEALMAAMDAWESVG